MEATVLNPVQQHLLKFFAFDGSEEKLLEMKAAFGEGATVIDVLTGKRIQL